MQDLFYTRERSFFLPSNAQNDSVYAAFAAVISIDKGIDRIAYYQVKV